MAVFVRKWAVEGRGEAVVWVKEDEEGVGLEGFPDGIEGWVIKTEGEAGGAEDDAFDVGEGGEAGDFLNYGLRSGGEGEGCEGVDFPGMAGGEVF